MSRRLHHGFLRHRQEGSALLVTLFVCLATAVVLQAAWGAIMLAQQAMVDESLGRQRLAEKNEILDLLCQRALSSWYPLDWTVLGTGEGRLSDVAPDQPDEWLLQAHARQTSDLSTGEVSTWIERGRDGLDLPMAALVAGTVTVAPGRETALVAAGGTEKAEAAVDCWLQEPPPDLLLGEGCAMHELESDWHLDEGWASFASTWASEGSEGDSEAAATAAPAAGVQFLATPTGPSGAVQTLPADRAGYSPDEPALVVLTGGGTLDATGQGDFYGVLVVDGGSLLLDGTVVHGAVFVSEGVDLGSTGRILFARDVLRWATDRSLVRARLVPATRAEVM